MPGSMNIRHHNADKIKKTNEMIQMCINNDESSCITPCNWSSEKRICTVPSVECNDITEKNKCSGTCLWSTPNAKCEEKTLICSDRNPDSCSGTCKWKFFNEPPETNNNGSCNSDRFMFIDNSPKSFVDGSNGKGMLQSIGSDMLSITPDKIYYAATGKSVPGSFEHQKCTNVSEFNMNATLRGFTSETFNFKAKKIYLTELADLLNQSLKTEFSLAIDLVQNITNDSILFTIRIYKLYKNNDSTLTEIQNFSNGFASNQSKFIRTLSQKLIEKKIYFDRELFSNQEILFDNVKCITNCPIETFSDYKENSNSKSKIQKNKAVQKKKIVQLNKTVCIALFLIFIVLVKYLFSSN